MKNFSFPTLDKLLDAYKKMLARFPLAYTAGVVSAGSFFSLILINDGYNTVLDNLILKAALVAGIASFAFLSVELYLERRQEIKQRDGWFAKVLSLVLTLGVYFLLPKDIIHASQAFHTRFFISALFFVLLAIVAPFFERGEEIDFWHWLRKMASNFILTMVLSGILFAGLLIAVAGGSQLFGYWLGDETAPQLIFIAIAGLVSIPFFLLKIPADFKNEEKSEKILEKMKSFGIYILLPLWLVYFIMLYVYFGKVVMQGNWPNGTVVYMITVFFLLGLALRWFLYPFHQNSWIEKFSRVSSVFSIPLIGVYFWAVILRLNSYGLTTNRYIVLAFGVLMVITLIYSIWKNFKFKVAIYFVLALIALTFVGPWSAFSLPPYLQYQALEKILTENNILENGQIKESSVSCEVKEEITQKLEYLVLEHDYNLTAIFGSIKGEGYNYIYNVQSYLQVDSNCTYAYRSDNFYYYNDLNEISIDVSGYNDLVRVSVVRTPIKFQLGKDQGQIELANDSPAFIVSVAGSSVSVNLSELLSNLVNDFVWYDSQVPFALDKYQVKFSSKDFSGKVIFENISFSREDNKYVINSASAMLLIKK